MTSWESIAEQMKESASVLEKAIRTPPTVDVTVKDGAEYPNGTSVLDVFCWLEYGTDRIAPRAFVRQTFAENANRYGRMLGRDIGRVVRGKLPLRTAYERVAESAAADIRKHTPVRTGRLRDSICVRCGADGVAVEGC